MGEWGAQFPGVGLNANSSNNDVKASHPCPSYFFFIAAQSR